MAIDQINLATISNACGRREVEAAHTYKLLAARETDPKRRDILLRLAAQEDKHAARWSERIEASTGRVPDPREVERGLTWFQRIGDSSVVLHRLEQEETKAEAEYGRSHDAAERSGRPAHRRGSHARRARPRGGAP